MLGKVYKGYYLINNMENKIVITIFMAIFLMSFIQAEIFGTPTTITNNCPAQIVCNTPEVIYENTPQNIIMIPIYILIGIIIGILTKAYGKNPFKKKKKKKTILDTEIKPTDVMFEESLKNLEEVPIKDEEKNFKW